MRRIVNREDQNIRSFYGWRWLLGKKRFHKGVDLRTRADHPDTGKPSGRKLKVVLPEKCKFIRSKFQKKWGWTHIFKGLESGKKLKFTHIEERRFQKDIDYYNEGFAVGYPVRTEYMIKKGLGEHCHFETWGKLKPFNPVKYMDSMEIKYNKKGAK